MQFNFVKLLAITASVASANVAAAASVIKREVWRFLLYLGRVYYWHTNEDGRRACSPGHSLDLWPRRFHSKNRPSQSRDQLHQPRFSLQEEYLLCRGFWRSCLWFLHVNISSHRFYIVTRFSFIPNSYTCTHTHNEFSDDSCTGNSFAMRNLYIKNLDSTEFNNDISSYTCRVRFTFSVFHTKVYIYSYFAYRLCELLGRLLVVAGSVIL